MVVAAFLFSLGLSACSGRASGNNASGGRSGAQASSSWAASADELRERWNTIFNDSYELSPFRGATASFSAGTVFYSNSSISMDTFDGAQFGTLCTFAYMAAYGSDHAEAHAVIAEAIDKGRRQPVAYVEYNGHAVNLSESENGQIHCVLYKHTVN